MSQYVLDHAYRVEEPNGVERNRVVVSGPNAESCVYPAGPNAGAALGVTTHSQRLAGRSVAVRRLGIAGIEAAGAIAVGDYVCVADNAGRIAAATPPSVVIGVEGQDSAVRYRALQPAPNNPVLSVEHIKSGNNTPLSATMTAGVIEVTLATDAGGNVTTNAAALVAFINSHPELSRLVRAELAGGNGSDPAAVATGGMTGYAASMNPIGIAQQAATNPGDIIDVFLIH